MKKIIHLFTVWIKNVIQTETDRAFLLPTSRSGMIEKSILDCRRRIAYLEKKFHTSRELDADWQQYLHTAGQALKEQKKRLEVRQQGLALLLEIHPTTISHWIQGRSVLSKRSCQKIAWLCNIGKTEARRKIALCKALRKEREAEGRFPFPRSSGSGGVGREVNSPARADLSSVALAKEEGGASPAPGNEIEVCAP